jgi:hypothetical protein
MKARTFKVIVSCICAAGILVSGLNAESRGTYTGVRAMGMGNAAIANTDDATAMLNNPAGLDLFMEHMQLSVNFAFYGSTGLLDLLSFASKQAKKLTDKNGLKSLDTKFYDDLYAIDGKWSTVGLIPNVAFMARTLDVTYGACYYWDIPTRVMVESGVLVPKIFIGTQMDQVFMGTMAKRFMKVLSVGASFKWIDRYVVDDIALWYTQTLEFIDRLNASPMSAINPLLKHVYGPGFDVGSIFHFGPYRAAVSIQDVFAYVGDQFLSPRFNVGFAYKLLNLMELKAIDDATVTLDLNNVFRHANFFTKVNLGSEVRLSNFDFRMGFHQGYFTMGTTLYFFIFHVDYLYYAEELGLYTNDSPLSYHLIQVGADIKF